MPGIFGCEVQPWNYHAPDEAGGLVHAQEHPSSSQKQVTLEGGMDQKGCYQSSRNP